MKNKSISIVSNNFWTIYKFRFDIVMMLLDKGYHLYLIAGNDSYVSKFNHPQITKILIPMSERGMNLFQEFNTFMAIYNTHKSAKPDLVFNFTLKANIYSGIVCRFLNIKYISMITGLGHIFIGKKIITKYVITILLSMALKKSLEIWFTNNFDRIYYKKNRINDFQVTKIVPGAGADFKINKPMMARNNKVISFIMIARLLKEKGVEEYINAANHFKNNKSLKFTLLGSHKNEKSYISKVILEKSINDGVIDYHDHREDTMPFMEQTSCVILPSYREGMSTVLLEAGILKIPIITTKVPGCIDIIPDDSYGTLCEASNTASLIKAINRHILLSENELKEQTLKVYNHIRDNYSRTKVLSIYKDSLKYIN
tara:strand:- start:43 stop:1152 length:1110 start_codon:yes stop_codon:yes gene_type:complete